MNKCYSELIKLKTFEERFLYLKENLKGCVGEDTFGFSRYLNQAFYTSHEYQHFRRDIILRDNGCDIGIEDRPIVGKIFLHHINPITKEDILQRKKSLLDPENSIIVSFETHNALHYGTLDSVLFKVSERTKNDTCPWKHV